MVSQHALQVSILTPGVSQHALRQTPPTPHTVIGAGGTHPTGMHSCLVFVHLTHAVGMGSFRNISASVTPLNPLSPERKDTIHSCAQRLKRMSRFQLL